MDSEARARFSNEEMHITQPEARQLQAYGDLRETTAYFIF